MKNAIFPASLKSFALISLLFSLHAVVKAQTSVTELKLKGKVKARTEKQYFGTYINGKFTGYPANETFDRIHFDAVGKATTRVFQQQGKIDSFTYTYNNEGKIISEQAYVNNKLTESTVYEYDAILRTGKKSMTRDTSHYYTLKKYDNLNNCIYEESSYPPYGTTIKKHQYKDTLLQATNTYKDEKPELIELFYYNKAKKPTAHKTLEPDSTFKYATYYFYGTDQKTLLKQYEEDQGGKYLRYTYEFKDNGKTKIEKEYYTDSSVHSISINRLDKFNNAIEDEFIRPKENRHLKTTFKNTYNAANQLIEVRDITMELLPSKEITYNFLWKYVYDSHGNLVKQYKIVGDQFQAWEFEIKYY